MHQSRPKGVDARHIDIPSKPNHCFIERNIKKTLDIYKKTGPKTIGPID